MSVDILPPEKYLQEIKREGNVLVCVRSGGKKFFDDDVTDFCDECGEEIRLRPYNKDAYHKICVQCALKDIEGLDWTIGS